MKKALYYILLTVSFVLMLPYIVLAILIEYYFRLIILLIDKPTSYVRNCGKTIEYKDMQVDHIVPKNRGMYSRWDEKQGKFAITQGEDNLDNYMPACRACNFRKRDMTLEQFRAEIKRQAVGLLKGAAKFQVKMSIAYGLIVPQFDKEVVFYFENVIHKD